MADAQSPAPIPNRKRSLPRLRDPFYQGNAWVFWTHTVARRETGWLSFQSHLEFREAALHAQAREVIACAIYVLMPDHLHCLWIGADPQSDQRLATRSLRRQLNTLLAPRKLQEQPHDHVLRESERTAGAFAATWQYVAENPVRAGLVDDWRDYPFLGALIPGYPGLDPREVDFLRRFWRVYHAFSDRHAGAKSP
jgi:putative transposase